MRLPKYDAPVPIFYLPFWVWRVISDYPYPSCQPDRVASVHSRTGANHSIARLHYHLRETGCAPAGRDHFSVRWKRPAASPKLESPNEFLPGEVLLLQVARPRDALLVSGRVGRKESGVGLEPHPPQVQAVGVPAHPDGLVLA